MFNAKDFEKQLQKAIFTELNNNREKIAQHVDADVAHIVCPDHNMSAKTRISKISPGGGKIGGFECCCNKLEELLAESLKE